MTVLEIKLHQKLKVIAQSTNVKLALDYGGQFQIMTSSALKLQMIITHSQTGIRLKYSTEIYVISLSEV